MRQPRRIQDRVCLRCAANHGHEGPRPFGSAIKLIGGELVYACSEKCAEKLGLDDKGQAVIAALYVATGGCYFGLNGVDPWDEPRDARRYAGPHPVVAHPPCARWSMLAGLVESRYGHKRGEDGGCFAAALACVRAFGGVLEHPAHSAAWSRYDLPAPPSSGGWVRGFCGGWTCQVEQGHYGHRARKATWLYAYGVSSLPSLHWGAADAKAWCTPGASLSVSRGKVVESMCRAERLATPIAFRDLLIGIAESASQR